MKNKTLIITENFPPQSGGSGRWFWELYSRLPKNEYIIVSNDSPECSDFDTNHNLNVIRMPLKSKEWGVASITGLMFYWRTFKRLNRLIRRHQISRVHVGRVLHEGVIAWLLKIFNKLEYICYVHGEDVETAALSREHNLMVKFVCKEAKTIICNSFNSSQIIKRLGYADQDKIEVLHPGVNSEIFIPSSQNKEFLEKMGWLGKKVIITVGRLQKRKGQDKMIEAMPNILKEHPNAIYSIIGSGECMEELISLTQFYNVNDAVQFFENIPDDELIKCYQHCDLFILPNRTIGGDIEGFGMVLVEAQSCGKPVVAGDSGGTKETMKIGESGIILDCTEAANLSCEVNKLLGNSDSLLKMGLEGRKHVLNQLDWSSHVLKASRLFNNS